MWDEVCGDGNVWLWGYLMEVCVEMEVCGYGGMGWKCVVMEVFDGGVCGDGGE